MVSIAHPDFRQDLINYAKDVKYFVLPEHEKFGGEALVGCGGCRNALRFRP